MFKPSIYNEYKKSGDYVYIYNPNSRACIKLEANTEAEAKKQLELIQNEELIEMGILTQSEDEIGEMIKKYNNMKFNPSENLIISLVMTYSCNCRCSYCFEKGSLNKVKIKNPSTEKVVDFICNRYKTGKFKSLELSFFGGEPLLKVNEIKEIIMLVKNRGISNFKTNVITNGVLLNNKNIKALENIGIYDVQITLDGFKEKHDAVRHMSNRVGTWNNIFNNLRNIRDNSNLFVTLRINLTEESSKDLVNIYKEIKENTDRNRIIIYLAPIIGVLDEKGFEVTLKKRADLLKKSWKIIKENELDIKISPPEYGPCPMHTIDSAFFIDMEGNQYNCAGFVGKDKYLDSIYDQKMNFFYERSLSVPELSCFKCSFFGLVWVGVVLKVVS